MAAPVTGTSVIGAGIKAIGAGAGTTVGVVTATAADGGQLTATAAGSRTKVTAFVATALVTTNQ